MKNPSMRPAIFVLLALALAAPTLAAVAGGTTTAISAGEHLVAAVLVAWVAVSVVAHLVDAYRASTLQRHQAHPGQQQPSTEP